MGMPRAPQKEMFNIHAQTTLSPRKQNMSPYSAHQGKSNPMYGTHLSDGLMMQKNNMGSGGMTQIEFVYDHDFDENGALYYLGTYGMKRSW